MIPSQSARVAKLQVKRTKLPRKPRIAVKSYVPRLRGYAHAPWTSGPESSSWAQGAEVGVGEGGCLPLNAWLWAQNVERWQGPREGRAGITRLQGI